MPTSALLLSILLCSLPALAQDSPANGRDNAAAKAPVAVTSAPAATETEKKKESFFSLVRDPEDGNFDLSRLLLEHRTALVVPIVVTEPAVGNGGGAAVVFFRKPRQSDESKQRGERVPPDIYGIAGLKTENGTWGYGLGGSFHFKDDTWRYAGAIGKTSVNLDFYPSVPWLASHKIGYNLDGIFLFQQVSRRLGRSRMFASLRWVYMDLDSRLNLPSDDQYFKPRELANKSSGLGAMLEYDSRDNTLTPSSGVQAKFNGTFYSPSLGSSNQFQSYRASTLAYFKIAPTWVLGTRIDYRTARGDVPFYQLPSIDMRGIAFGHYQDQNVAMTEAQLRWNVTPRWAPLIFAGAGRAWGRKVDFGQADTEYSKGVGFRYLIARALGLYAGLDWAWGPNEHAYYLQVGSAWR